MGKGQVLYAHAKELIPGGTQLLSKRPEMFAPDQWPAYYQRAQGCHVWDLDGKEYVDMSLMGVGANILGYCDPDVDKAVLDAVQRGNMCTLNCAEEVELAERLCDIHPWADMVRYAKTGGESMAIAVRIARATTGRDIVLFSGYHGWHDWYLAANIEKPDSLAGVHLSGLAPAGVPKNLFGSAYPFYYNQLHELEALIRQYGSRIAAVVMEPIRSYYPEDDFLNRAAELARKNGSVVLFDEISSGMRLCLGGAHLALGAPPDMAVFAKAISNGYPQGIIIGKRGIMEAAQASFISSTFWTERIGLTATLATFKKYEEEQVELHLDHVGTIVQNGWENAAVECGLDIHVSGIKPLSHFEFKCDEAAICKTYFTQEMLEEGYLASTGYYASFAHGEADIKNYLEACARTYQKIADVLQRGESLKPYLKGHVCHTGFERLTK